MICVDSNNCTFRGSMGSCKECTIRKGYTFGMFITDIPKIECDGFNVVAESRLTGNRDSYRASGITLDSKSVGSIMVNNTKEIENVIGFGYEYIDDELNHVNDYLRDVEKALKLNLDNTRNIYNNLYTCKLFKNTMSIKQEILVNELDSDGKYSGKEHQHSIYAIKIKVEDKDGNNRPVALISARNEYNKVNVYSEECGKRHTFYYGRINKVNVIETTSDTTIRPIEIEMEGHSIIMDGIFIYNKTAKDIVAIAEWRKDILFKSKDFDKAVGKHTTFINAITDVVQKYKFGIAPYWIMDTLKIKAK